MNCENYLELSPKEKVEFIGKLIHAVQSDNYTFNKAVLIINRAEKKGLYAGVTINPSTQLTDDKTILDGN